MAVSPAAISELVLRELFSFCNRIRANIFSQLFFCLIEGGYFVHAERSYFRLRDTCVLAACSQSVREHKCTDEAGRHRCHSVLLRTRCVLIAAQVSAT